MKNTPVLCLALMWLSLMFVPVAPAVELKGTGNALAEEMMKASLSQERERAFSNAMADIPVEEQKKFWEEYKVYAAEKEGFDKTRFDLVDKYMTNYLILTPAQTKDLTEQWIALQKDELQSRIKMYKRLSKKISPAVGTRFYQVDDYVSAALKVQHMSRYPLLGDTPK